MIECNDSSQWHMECFAVALLFGAFVRKLMLAFHCLFSNHNLPRYLKTRCHNSYLWYHISYQIRPSFITSKDSGKVFATPLLCKYLYICKEYMYTVYCICHIQLTPTCLGAQGLSVSVHTALQDVPLEMGSPDSTVGLLSCYCKILITWYGCFRK